MKMTSYCSTIAVTNLDTFKIYLCTKPQTLNCENTIFYKCTMLNN